MMLLAAAFTQEFDQRLESSAAVYAWCFSQFLYKHLLLPLIFVRKKPYEISGISCL